MLYRKAVSIHEIATYRKVIGEVSLERNAEATSRSLWGNIYINMYIKKSWAMEPLARLTSSDVLQSVAVTARG